MFRDRRWWVWLALAAGVVMATAAKAFLNGTLAADMLILGFLGGLAIANLSKA